MPNKPAIFHSEVYDLKPNQQPYLNNKVLCLWEIERAGCTGTWALHDVEVDHGGGDDGVSEEVLDGRHGRGQVCRW